MHGEAKWKSLSSYYLVHCVFNDLEAARLGQCLLIKKSIVHVVDYEAEYEILFIMIALQTIDLSICCPDNSVSINYLSTNSPDTKFELYVKAFKFSFNTKVAVRIMAIKYDLGKR